MGEASLQINERQMAVIELYYLQTRGNNERRATDVTA